MKKLKLEDLRIGQRVEISQLSDIRDTLVVIALDSKDSKNGVINYIGFRDDPESEKAFRCGKPVSAIFFDSSDVEGDEFYDE